MRYHQSQSKQGSFSYDDSLFTVVLQCKSVDPDSDNASVCCVVVAPEPTVIPVIQVILCTNLQVQGMVHF